MQESIQMSWSPQDAMKAYLQTIHMCKENNMHDDEVQKCGIDGNKVIEPQGIELLAALAAGNQARTILDITTSQQQQGVITPLTLALAVAARQTGGRLICIRPDPYTFHGSPHRHDNIDAGDEVTEIRVGDPCELIDDIRDVDFAVIDCAECDSTRLRLLSEKLHLNPKGAVFVANNISNREQGVALADKLLKGKRGVESSVSTLPLGSSGFQLIVKIKSITVDSPRMRVDSPRMMLDSPRSRKHKRFFVTFDD